MAKSGTCRTHSRCRNSSQLQAAHDKSCNVSKCLDKVFSCVRVLSACSGRYFAGRKSVNSSEQCDRLRHPLYNHRTRVPTVSRIRSNARQQRCCTHTDAAPVRACMCMHTCTRNRNRTHNTTGCRQLHAPGNSSMHAICRNSFPMSCFSTNMQSLKHVCCEQKR